MQYTNTDTVLAEVTGRSSDDCPPAVESADRPDNTGTGSAAVADVQSCVTGLPATSADARAREYNAMRVMPGALKMQDRKMQDLKMEDLLGMRRAFVVRGR